MKMEDSVDDLEPLFDYKRVQPSNCVCIDDDSDTSTSPLPKRVKTANHQVHDDIEVIKVVEDEDWLPPPPKVTKNDNNQLVEDPTIKALRLKKQELLSLAKSAEGIMCEVKNSAKKGTENSTGSPTEAAAKQPSKHASERAKIVISIQDKDGQNQYRVFMDDKFDQLYKKYAERGKLDMQNLVFLFDGERISPSATPAELGMEDDDMIEAHMKRR